METANLNHHGQAQPYPALPASPTLTNPDMILPDYDRASSPDPELDSRDHSLVMWKNAHAATSVADIHQARQNPDHPYGPTGPITPTTPIIYGNGTMLSDIGEVTEVESTRGGPSPLRSKGPHYRQRSPGRGSGSDTTSRTPPATVLEGTIKKRSKQNLAAQRERRSSIESTSTITTHEKQNMFADFDDSVSVDDSVFQGDDEESVAESYTQQDATSRENALRLGVPNVDNSDRMSTYSMSSISRRAEDILANAKKRLTTMEGNLSRARSSLYVTTPSISGSDGSTPSPPAQRAATALYARDAGADSLLFSPSSHTRSADDGFGQHHIPNQDHIPTQRSASALGVSGGYRQPPTSPRSPEIFQPSVDNQPSHRRTWHQRDHTLEPLSEDEVTSAVMATTSLQEPTRPNRKLNSDQFLTPTFASFSDSGSIDPQRLQRSVSVAQMRDLKDQVKGLKGKISSLREQARVDSLKRRSLQSLRTPSPFTHARIDQWYAGTSPTPVDAGANETDPLSSRNPWNGELSTIDGDEDERSTQDGQDQSAEGESAQPQGRDAEPNDRETPVASAYRASDPGPQEAGDDVSDMLTENGDAEEAGGQAENGAMAEAESIQDQKQQVDAVWGDNPAYESESGESLYHDTLQHPVSHEDREDAFDYEHFFLHSAMGTISQQRLRRGSGSSFSSNGSVETARGPVVDSDASRSRNRTRRRSDASVSTVETFATADDGSTGSVRGRSVPASSRSSSEGSETFNKPPSAAGNLDSTNRPPFTRHSTGSIISIPEEEREDMQPREPLKRQAPGSRRPLSSSATATANSLHRPSVSSFESVGTQRSFPLVNRPKKANSVGVLTPQNSSPDHDLKAISESLLSQATSLHGQAGDGVAGLGRPNGSQALQNLVRDDRYLVERLVAGLGRCVLGLTENGKASSENRMYRRRIEAARKILEGLDVVREGDD